MGRIKVGDTFETNHNGKLTVVHRESGHRITSEFEDGTRVITTGHKLRVGEVRNPNRLSVWGVGFLGQGKYTSRTVAYGVWENMLARCYDSRTQNKHPSYKGVEVCEDWHNHQIFAEWYNSQPQPDGERFQLDKDILCKGNKLYSPQYCRLVPQSINALMSTSNKGSKLPLGVSESVNGERFYSKISKNGRQTYLGTYNTIAGAFEAYAVEREGRIQEEAQRLRGVIPVEIYEALMRWKVEATD